MLRLACALGALQTVADAFPAISLVPRVRCAPQTPVASMRPTRIAAFAVAGEPAWTFRKAAGRDHWCWSLS